MFSGSAIKKIEKNHDKNFVQLYFKAGRTIKDNSFLNAEIRATVNSYYCYTKLGLREKLNNKNISTSELSRQFKQAGVTRKRINKKSKVLLDISNKKKKILRRNYRKDFTANFVSG